MLEEITTRRPLPSDKKYFDELYECSELLEYIYFTPDQASLIVCKETVVGFLNLLLLEEKPRIYEIQIAIFPKYQKMGFASAIMRKVEDNLFSFDDVQQICMNIDKTNEKSVALARSLGYEYNEEKVNDFYLGGNNRTLEYIKNNPNYFSSKEK